MLPPKPHQIPEPEFQTIQLGSYPGVPFKGSIKLPFAALWRVIPTCTFLDCERVTSGWPYPTATCISYFQKRHLMTSLGLTTRYSYTNTVHIGKLISTLAENSFLLSPPWWPRFQFQGDDGSNQERLTGLWSSDFPPITADEPCSATSQASPLNKDTALSSLSHRPQPLYRITPIHRETGHHFPLIHNNPEPHSTAGDHALFLNPSF